MTDRIIGSSYIYYIEPGARRPASGVMGYNGTITYSNLTFWNTGQYNFGRDVFSPTGIEL
jgi:hypothetical protein